MYEAFGDLFYMERNMCTGKCELKGDKMFIIGKEELQGTKDHIGLSLFLTLCLLIFNPDVLRLIDMNGVFHY